MSKNYNISDYGEDKLYNSDDIFILDDRPRKFDEKKGRFVAPDDPIYDTLPDIVL